MESSFTVAICTRNRAELLKSCLDALAKSLNGRRIPIVVINNGSTDGTTNVLKEFSNELDITCLYEEIPGLSRARNLAWQSCKADYIVYLDDDAKPMRRWIPAIEAGIGCWKPAFFGGPIRPFYLSEKPQWFDESYGAAYLDRKEGPMLPRQFVSGGNMGWRVEILRELGGFPEKLGMKGGKIGIGEETYLQRRAQKELGTGGHFLPDMEILHYVPPEKMTLGYQARRMWQAGWQNHDIGIGTKPLRVRSILYEIGSVPIYFVQMFFRNRTVDPHWKSWVYRKLCPRLRFWGRFARYWSHVVAQALRRVRR